MLYHLINLNPHQDITLHVSVNNSAMVCYCFIKKNSGQTNFLYLAPLQPIWIQSRTICRGILFIIPRPTVARI